MKKKWEMKAIKGCNSKLDSIKIVELSDEEIII